MFTERALKDIVSLVLKSAGFDAFDRDWTVAVSGGVDSMVLLHVLKQVADERGITCSAVHVHHGLRASAGQDSQFVETVCNNLGVKLDVKYVDVLGVSSEHSKGTEADARELRYRAIVDSVMERRQQSAVLGELTPHRGGAPEPIVFLAHHADDQTETVLMRLARGTSPKGLAGMRPVRGWQGVIFIRPFLTVDKSRLIRYAKEQGISFVQDETNFDTRYTRNFIRHEIVPKLTQMQPNLNQAVQRLSEVLRAEDDLLDSMAREHFHRLVHRHEGAFAIDQTSLLTLPLPLQRRLIHIILYCLTPADWTFDHMDSILRLCGESDPSRALHLPNQTLVRRVYNQVQFLREEPSKSATYRVFWALPDEPACLVDHPRWTFQRTPWYGQQRSLTLTSPYEAVVPEVSGLSIHPGAQGERLKVLGLNGSKKLQDLFVDAKIPRHLRRSWPCVYVETELVWIPGVARSDSYLLSPSQDGWHIQAKKGQ